MLSRCSMFASDSDMITRTALIVVDVQEGIATLPDGVPDADKIVLAIGSIIQLARQRNEEVQMRNEASERSVKLLFVQHDDKDPEDPLHRGKPTWDLVFPPRQGLKTESLISKNVGRYQSGYKWQNCN